MSDVVSVTGDMTVVAVEDDITVISIGTVGPEGPSQVSADAGNMAEIGSDYLIYVNITPAEIGLDQVDNTSDADKPVSDATQAALDALESGSSAALDAEEAARIAADEALQDNIDAEASARTAADSDLSDDIAAEATARSTADDALQDAIDAEASARSAADSDLNDDIVAEAAARTTADSTLQDNIDSEALSRSNADDTLQDNIDAEASARASADSTLNTSIATEATTRGTADTALQANIDAEATARASADSTLTTAISSEASARAAADALLIPLAQKAAANGVATLDSGGKVPASQLPNTVMEYQGTWNASTNTPTLADGAGSSGDVYRVSVAASRDLGSGSISFEVGDYVIYNGTAWEKSDTTDSVPTVFGRTGNITAQAGDYTATQVTNTPAGGISATTVQAAINELDTEKGDMFLATAQAITGKKTLTGAATTDVLFAAKVAGDAFDRFQVLCDGTLKWGSGASGTFVNLYRNGAGNLKTDDNFTANALSTSGTISGNTLNLTAPASVFSFTGQSSASNVVFRSFLTGDTSSKYRFQVKANGQLEWGSGAADPDVTLSRTGADTIAMGAGDKIQQSSAPVVGDDLTNRTFVDAQILAAKGTAAAMAIVFGA